MTGGVQEGTALPLRSVRGASGATSAREGAAGPREQRDRGQRVFIRSEPSPPICPRGRAAHPFQHALANITSLSEKVLEMKNETYSI